MMLLLSSTWVGEMALLAAHISPLPMMPMVVLLSGKRRGCDGSVLDSVARSLTSIPHISLLALDNPGFHRDGRSPTNEHMTRDIHESESPVKS